MNYNFTNQIVGFYVRGKRERLIDEQLAELFLFAMLHRIPAENTRLIQDRIGFNGENSSLNSLISNPYVDYLIVRSYHILDVKYDTYLYLKSALESSNIKVINLSEYAKQAGE
ncbi:hypothetical protein P9H28_13060 [Paenibacillus barengoltzii]|uniref:hypothetical protein n=1 Tax=Paenibacillus barengoltzii TaxID=343517 RepID=UPI002DB81068|nr:hypothetical protein [Paenibacillus barengoltzii]MEC2345013.1 hypothetical protein [Paenibacillus barengoltzii]